MDPRAKISGPQSLLSSVFISVFASGWSVILSLVTVPITVHGLGLSSYGLYTVSFSIVALGSYLDFGLGWSTARFVAVADHESTPREVGTAVVASLAFQFAICVVFAAGVIVCAGWITANILRLRAEQVLAETVIRVAALSFVVTSLTGVLQSALRGTRRFAIATLIGAVAMTISVGGAAAAAWAGLGVIAAALAQLSGALFGLIASVVFCRAFLTASHGGKELWKCLRGMLGFSAWSYGSRLFQMLVLHADKIVMARWVGPGALPYYSVPFSLTQRINFVAGPAVSAIYPMAAVSRFDREVFVRQYLNAARLVHVSTAALALSLLFWGDRFLAAWIGADMGEHGTFFLRVMTMGFWLVSVGSFDSACIEGAGKPRLNFFLSAAASVIGLAFGTLAWNQIGPAKALAVGVACFFAAVGLGSSIAWFRMIRYPVTFMARRVALPLAEMTAFAALFSVILRDVLEARVFVIAALFCLVAVLLCYGIFRAFSLAEISSVRARIIRAP